MALRGDTKFSLVCMLGPPCLAMLLALSLPRIANVRRQRQSRSCRSNLKQIWAAIQVYRQQENSWPPDLGAIRMSEADGMKCPAVRSGADSPSYRYRVPVDEDEVEPLVSDSSPRHQGRANVLLDDGSITSVVKRQR